MKRPDDESSCCAARARTIELLGAKLHDGSARGALVCPVNAGLITGAPRRVQLSRREGGDLASAEWGFHHGTARTRRPVHTRAVESDEVGFPLFRSESRRRTATFGYGHQCSELVVRPVDVGIVNGNGLRITLRRGHGFNGTAIECHLEDRAAASVVRPRIVLTRTEARHR